MKFTLGSELAVLLVATGESETFTVLLFDEPADLTLYIEEAGMLVTSGFRFPLMLRLMSICLIAISKDFFERVLPNPELSDNEDLPELLWAE